MKTLWFRLAIWLVLAILLVPSIASPCSPAQPEAGVGAVNIAEHVHVLRADDLASGSLLAARGEGPSSVERMT